MKEANIESESNGGGWEERIYFMDNLRAVAMFLGVVLHAAIFYCYFPLAPFRQHAENSKTLYYMVDFIHIWRMELFFLVSGFFGALLLNRKTLKYLIVNRTKRIVLPFIACLLFLQPWWSAIQMKINDDSAPGFWSLYFSHLSDPLTVLRLEWPIGQWFQHTWFLQVLILFLSVQILFNYVFSKLPSFGEKANFWLEKVLSSKFGLYWLILITYFVLLLSPPWSDVPQVGVPLNSMFFFGLFYFFGYLVFKSPKILNSAIDNLSYNWIPMFLGIGFLLTQTSSALLSIPIEILAQDLSLFKATQIDGNITWAFPFLENKYNFSGWFYGDLKWHLYSLAKSYTVWFTVVAIVFLFKSFSNKENVIGRYLSQSSYWVYLLHFPLQFTLAYYFFSEYSLSPMLGFFCVLLSSTIICLLSYHILVRGTFIGTFLSGRRFPLSLSREVEWLKSCFSIRTALAPIAMLFVFLVCGLMERDSKFRFTQFGYWKNEEKIGEGAKDEPELLMASKRLDGRTPLHMASTILYKEPSIMPGEGKIDKVIRLLVEKGFNVDKTDDTGQTPLHYAVKTGNFPALTSLIDLGANPNIGSKWNGETPLHMASVIGSIDMIDALLEGGADVSQPRADGMSANDLHFRFHGSKIESLNSEKIEVAIKASLPF